jgi:succinate dehydrogenase / fumarate reductase iron-sulfur subunit
VPRSYGGNSWFGKFHPAAGKELLSLLPSAVKAIARGKIGVKLAMLGHKIPPADLEAVKRIYQTVESRPERYELNLYISGEDEDEPTPVGATVGAEANGDHPAAVVAGEGSAN